MATNQRRLPTKYAIVSDRVFLVASTLILASRAAAYTAIRDEDSVLLVHAIWHTFAYKSRIQGVSHRVQVFHAIHENG